MSAFHPKKSDFFAFYPKNSKRQVIWFFQLFTLRNRKVKSKSDFFLLRTQTSIFHSKKSDFFFSEPKFNFSLPEPSQNRISSLQEIEKSSQNRIFFLLRTEISIFHSKKSDFFFLEPKFRFFTPRNLIFFFSEPKFNFSLQESKSDFFF